MSTEILELKKQMADMTKQFEGLKHLVAYVAEAIGKPEESKPGPAGEWINGDEACKILGIPISKSGTHKNRLAWLRQSGYLSRFGCRKPYTYSRKEVLEVLDRIQKGKLALPSRA